MIYYDAEGNRYSEEEAKQINEQNNIYLAGDVSQWPKIKLLFSGELIKELNKRG